MTHVPERIASNGEILSLASHNTLPRHQWDPDVPEAVPADDQEAYGIALERWAEVQSPLVRRFQAPNDEGGPVVTLEPGTGFYEFAHEEPVRELVAVESPSQGSAGISSMQRAVVRGWIDPSRYALVAGAIAELANDPSNPILWRTVHENTIGYLIGLRHFVPVWQEDGWSWTSATVWYENDTAMRPEAPGVAMEVGGEEDAEDYGKYINGLLNRYTRFLRKLPEGAESPLKPVG